ncbi:hypothetical protein LDENG_00008350 [Lucifuga dentata]|nr:hypothetical protein LDENG_00008350 [Lucifuga dentata]
MLLLLLQLLLWSSSLHLCSPRGVKRVVRSRRSCQCHRGGEAAEVSERRGESEASSTACHCSAAAAALEPHREELSFSGRFSLLRREDHCFCEGE